MIRLAAYLTLCCLGSSALADLDVAFVEETPKDQFIVTNTGVCDLPETTVTLDLDAAHAGLIFAVTVTGTAADAPRPFDFTEGRNRVLGLPELKHGDTVVSVNLSGLYPDESVVFYVDVHSTQTAQPSTPMGSEIEGAMITAVSGEDIRKAAFDEDARAVLTLDPCLN